MKSPQELNAVDVKGTVEVAFKVDDDGKFTDFNILRGLTPEIDAEVIRVLKLYPEKPIIKYAQGNPQRISNTMNIEHPRADQ
jgi:TonB family protein